MNILIIEDDRDFASYLESLVAGKWGHRVTTAQTGREGVEKLWRGHFHLVLLDIYLPNGLGHDFIDRLRQKDDRVNIVAMTGYNNLELEQEVRARGVAYYMIKPFELASLKAVIDHLEMKVAAVN